MVKIRTRQKLDTHKPDDRKLENKKRYSGNSDIKKIFLVIEIPISKNQCTK